MRETDRVAGFYRSLRESYMKNRQASRKGGVQGTFWGGHLARLDSTEVTEQVIVHEAKTAYEVTLTYRFGEKVTMGGQRLAWAGKRECWGTGRDTAACSGGSYGAAMQLWSESQYQRQRAHPTTYRNLEQHRLVFSFLKSDEHILQNSNCLTQKGKTILNISMSSLNGIWKYNFVPILIVVAQMTLSKWYWGRYSF